VSERVRRIYEFYVVVLCSLALAVTHGSRIVSNFHEVHWEDRGFFQYNTDQIHGFTDCFLKPEMWPGLYRPITTNLYYFLGPIFFGNRIEVYHIINLVLIITNALLLYRIAAHFLGFRWSLIVPLLFVTRLATVEVVLHTCEFQGIFSVFFTLLSLELFIQARASSRVLPDRLSILAFALSLLCKETSAILPALLLVYGWLFDRSLEWRKYVPHLIVVVVWAILFATILQHHRATGFGYDFSVSNLLRNYSAHALDFSNLLIAPLDDWVMPGRVGTLADSSIVRIIFALLICAEVVMLVLARNTKNDNLRILTFGFAWFLLATLPFAIFDRNRLFMRYSYLGHAGLSLCLAAIVREFARFASSEPAIPTVDRQGVGDASLSVD
jgi:hypothetical protein